ncbi:protein slit-like isoform X4 [Dermacentor albipictus]|uniref:protein slit-like isoform X4 n=1 Tax=Dermacentor albipictus TaxID=60249 RepID=UPI0031FE3983
MRRLTSPAGVLVVAAALLAAAQARKQASCPQAAFLMPCRCIEASIGLRILCSGIRSTHHLEVPFSYLRAYDLNALTLQHVNFSITVDLFKGLNVVTIKILHSTFRVSPMQGHNDATIIFGSMLQGLDVRHTDLDLGDAHLGATDSLRHVMVDTSTIEVLRRNWFHGLMRLKTFSIENTRIERVEDEALSGLDSVEEIKLPSNRLQKVRRTYFPQLASNLRHLDLSDNELTSLPSDMFQNMPVLESVTLSRNHFQTLSPEPWKPMLGQLRLVTLDGNPIDCNGTISWMLQSNARHKVSGTCAAPPNLAGTRISDLDDSRLRR